MVVDAQEFSERLRIAIGNESVNHFAKRCDIAEATMRNYFKGRFPTADVALELANAAGVQLEWLLSGRGVKDAGQAMLSSAVTGGENLIDDKAITVVPRLEVQASAGHGALAQSEEAVDFVAFQSAWLRSIGITPSFARIISARGDSMELTIRDGDLLLVDTSVSEVLDNGIYCVVFGNMLLVKRIHVRMNGSLQLISDNPIYPPEDVMPAEVQQLSIAGRVMWFGRSI